MKAMHIYNSDGTVCAKGAWFRKNVRARGEGRTWAGYYSKHPSYRMLEDLGNEIVIGFKGVVNIENGREESPANCNFCNSIESKKLDSMFS